MDYVLSMDADTIVPPNYMKKIIGQMKRDGIVVAMGKYANDDSILPIEPGM